MNDNLSKLIPSIPENIQAGLAIFITEISNIVATAREDTVLTPWGIFRQSDDLVHWLTGLTPNVIQPIVGIPLTGPQLVTVLINTFMYVNRGRATPNERLYEVGRSNDILPSDVPILVKYLIMRLDILHRDLIGLVLDLPPPWKAGRAAILNLAPPEISQDIVNFIVDIHDNIVEEDIPDWEEPIALDLYSILVDPELIRFLLELPEDLLAPYWPTQHGGYDLVQKIASSQIVVDFQGPNTPTPYTVAKSRKFRLEVGLPLNLGVCPKYTMERVIWFIGSLPRVPLRSLTEHDTECSICTQSYTDGRTRNDMLKSPVRLQCGHIFCWVCLCKLLRSEEDGGQEHDLCPMCRAKIIVMVPNDYREREVNS